VIQLAPSPRELATQVISHAATGNLEQPPTRIVRYTLVGPLHGGCEQRLLYRVLGGVEVSESSQHRGQNLRRKFAQ
jgi:hypothetical protein